MYRRPEGYPHAAEMIFTGEPPAILQISFRCSIEPPHRRDRPATVLMAAAEGYCPPVVGVRELRMLSAAIHAALVPHIDGSLKPISLDIIDTGEHAGVYD
jgi:hypothetical protein